MKTIFISTMLILFCFTTILKAQTEQDSVYTNCDFRPQFPGGDDAMITFIINNLKYPDSLRESGIQGTVFVSFIVEKDGSITNIRILRGISPKIDEEAMNVIRKMPRWKPAIHSGKVVRFQFNFPIKFTI